MKPRDEAVSQVLSSMVGAVVLLSSIAALMTTTAHIGSDEPGNSVEVHGSSLAHMLVDSAGLGWDPASGTVVRLGIAQTGGAGLDRVALASLRGASLAADADNNAVDYEEAKASLGLSDWDFRVTVAPVGLADELAAMDLGGIRTAYVGSWTTEPSASVEDEGDIVPAARLAVDSTASDVAIAERQALSELGLGYGDETDLDSLLLDVFVEDGHITQAVPGSMLRGDVFPDSKQYLLAVLPDRLPQYDLLVVGSGVQHNALTADVVKNAVRDWVLAGGTLLVLGSDSQTTQWLQPLFHVGTANVNGGAYAPHTTHPMLREPHGLSWTDYPTPANAWDIRDQGAQAHEDDFDHVLRADGGDLLGVSRPGAFGDGQILLTSYQPGSLGEGQAFLHNAIVFMDRSHLYLEYGAVPPAGVEVGTALRHSLLQDDAMGPVPVRIQVMVWRQA